MINPLSRFDTFKNMTKTAWVFPGQGSQSLGMGLDLADTAIGQQRYAEAEQLLGWSVPQLCQNEDKLGQTLYTQPCLYVVSAILADLMAEQGHHPALVAGHSLGEYPALYAAGVFDFGTGLKLVQERAQLMNQAADGSMAALIGFDREQLDAALAQETDVVLANDNHAGQVVISGSQPAIAAFLTKIKVKRAVPLNVSGAFHSPLMAEAAAAYTPSLTAAIFKDAKVPVLSNVQPEPSTDAELLRLRLVAQMTGGVRWRETCLKFLAAGIAQVIEVGPGKVLTGIIKRTCPEATLLNVGSLAELAALTPAA
jgi:[acyl-carrier-protein] S-malonyltransferase